MDKELEIIVDGEKRIFNNEEELRQFIIEDLKKIDEENADKFAEKGLKEYYDKNRIITNKYMNEMLKKGEKIDTKRFDKEEYDLGKRYSATCSVIIVIWMFIIVWIIAIIVSNR